MVDAPHPEDPAVAPEPLAPQVLPESLETSGVASGDGPERVFYPPMTGQIPFEPRPRRPLAPLAGADRVDLIDSLRGFAVLGILLMNMSWFAWPPARHYGAYLVTYASGLDKWMDLSLRFLAEGKFYIIFSFLFGLGMAVQKERIEARGGSFFSFFARRMFWLTVIGLVHGCFVWSGDILVTYALTGGLLLVFTTLWHVLMKSEFRPLLRFFGGQSPAAPLAWALVLLSLMCYLAVDWSLRVSQNPEIFQDTRQEQHFSTYTYEHDLSIYKFGTYAETTRLRIKETLQTLDSFSFLGVLIMASYLFGAFAWRQRIFTEIEGNRTLLRRVFLFGAAIGLVANALYIAFDQLHLPQSQNLPGFLGHFFGQYTLGYAYLAGLTLLYGSGRWLGLFRQLAPVGRMALTNYLLHSVVFTLVFNSYGLRLMGEIGEAQAYLLGFCVYGLQIVGSGFWLRHFRFGPMEWVWRSLTYFKLQPMLRREHANQILEPSRPDPDSIREE